MTKPGKPKDPVKMLENGRFTEEELEQAFYWLAERMTPKKPVEPKLIHLAATVEEAQKLRAEAGELIGLSTGWASVDRMFGGIRGSQLITIFGETGHRKSMFVQNLALNVASAGHPVLFIGLEMSAPENTERFLDMGGDASLPIVYPEASQVDYKDVDGLVKAAVEDRVELVIVDHLHFFALDAENEQAGLTRVCMAMKAVAVKYQTAVILVSHISKRRDTAGPPSLGDLKGSSSIAQLSDKAISVYSQGMDEDMPDDELTLQLKKSRRRAQQTTVKLNILPTGRLTEQSGRSWGDSPGQIM